MIRFGTVKNLYNFNNDSGNGAQGPVSQCLGKLVILPDSKFKLTWNMVVVVLLIYTATFVPYKVAFVEEPSKSDKVIDYIIDILFTIDIFINFMSGYEDEEEGKVIKNIRLIALSYLKSWFFPDVLACIPFGLIMPDNSVGTGNTAATAKLVRLARLPRLYRLIRIIRMLKMIKIMKNSSFL